MRRPALRYHGGKFRVAPWVISHFPKHEIYVEPFGGAASVLLCKPRSRIEVYNDLNDDVVNFFRVIRDAPSQLAWSLKLTPFARAEFDLAYEPTDDPIEAARRLVCRSFMGHGSSALLNKKSTGFRATSHRQHTSAQDDWSRYPAHVPILAERMSKVLIESGQAIECMQKHDTPATLHYVDPPYMHETRGCRHFYRHELADREHIDLAETLHGLQGMVVISGYDSPLYDELYGDWYRAERSALADGARKRTEVLWCSRGPVQQAMLL